MSRLLGWCRIITIIWPFSDGEQAGLTGTSSDPNNPDTDGDGLLDGIEVIFTTWNSTDSVWTLNPLVPNQGGYDSDGDGVGDLVELNLTSNLPINGETYPWAYQPLA
ncbi:MAG: hypothetical protein Ct9H90mP26_0790 [Methanobacteriota archaeon]|nr:MAG: hypothetical protein Ct9H90mP26_0790 [Euryarchaeota archaeon]